MSAKAIRDDPVIDATMKVLIEDEPTSSAGDLPVRDKSLDPTLQRVPESAVHNYYRHWGLNE
jgi:hypothetical protein